MKKRLMTLRVFMSALFIIFTISIAFHANATDAVCFEVKSIEIQETDHTVPVAISITNNPGFASADIHIECELPIVDIQSDTFTVFYSAKTGNINWSNTKNNTVTGDIINISFGIPEEVKPGDAWDVLLTVTEIIDEDTNTVPYSITNGKISIKQSDSQEIEITEPAVEPIKKPTFWGRIVLFFQRLSDWFKRIINWVKQEG